MIKYQCSGWLKYKKGSSDLRGFTYTYDASGNITKIVTEGTNVPQAALTKEYTYDALGQLATEVNGSGTTFGYAYDTAGNIRSITRGGTTLKSFGYTNPSWPDLLTSVTANGTTKDVLYEGQSRTSDLPSSGNPVTYYNGRDYHFDWSKGRQLTEAVVGGQTVKYAYDMSGVRSSKQVGDTTYTYTTLSGKVMRQQWGNKSLEFVYDDGNQPFAMIYKHGSTAELYYYLVNAQGDVAAILDSSGTMVASYNYGAWGSCTVYNSSDAAIGDLNPLRYRGYYYDAETGFYYLQSRYYDPANCRFINADGQLSVVDFSAVNLFAYCGNNPVNYIDPSGHAFMLITAAIGAVVGGVIGGITAAKNGGNIWAGVGTGMVIGGLVGMGAGAAIGIACAGSAAASTAAVATGFSALNAIVASSGVAAGAKMVGDNISRAFNAFPQVFWSGGDLAKNAACEFAKNASVGGKTLEMTRLGEYLQAAQGSRDAWRAASLNFANVAKSSKQAIYSIQNASGIYIDSIWATTEYNIVKGCEITYGVVSQNGYIQFLP